MKPTVAILNVGVEELKGSDVIKDADKLLREANIPMDYRGFTEGHGLGGGEVDVVVTDGFTGNIALKTAEGTAIKFQVAANEASDIYIGELGVAVYGVVSVSGPTDGCVLTAMLG